LLFLPELAKSGVSRLELGGTCCKSFNPDTRGPEEGANCLKVTQMLENASKSF
jgi:hypothetical protein